MVNQAMVTTKKTVLKDPEEVGTGLFYYPEEQEKEGSIQFYNFFRRKSPREWWPLEWK
jgi:hypothetical protein